MPQTLHYPPRVRRPVTTTAILALLCGCSPDEPAPQPAPPIPGCRPDLECALYEGKDCQTRDVVDALVTCRDEQGVAALTAACFPDLERCYYGDGGPGEASCGAVWSCFGDCPDNACYDGCLAAASPSARPLFATVEICSDHHRVFECPQGGPECDIAALHGPCASTLDACLDHVPATLPDTTTTACTHLSDCGLRDEAACLTAATRILTGCPTADRQRWHELSECLANVACADDPVETCGGWAPSELCREVRAPSEPEDAIP